MGLGDLSRRRFLFYGSILSILVILFFEVVGHCFFQQTTGEGARAVLTTLVIAQASILGIVFSVTLLAAQIASTKYSPKLIHLFVKSDHLIAFVAFVILSIFFDIVVVFFAIPSTDSLEPHQAGWAYGAVGVAMLVMISLIPYMVKVSEDITPSGLLELHSKQKPFDTFVEEARSAEEENTLSKHPLQEVFDLTRNSLDRREFETAKAGENALHTKCQNILEECVNSASSTFSEYKDFSEIFDPVFENYLRRLAIRTSEEYSLNLCQTTISHIRELGEYGAKNASSPNYFTFKTYVTFDKLLREAYYLDERSKNKIVWSVVASYTDFLTNLSSIEGGKAYNDVVEMSSTQNLASTVYKLVDYRSASHAVRTIFKSHVDSQKNLLANNRDVFDDLEIGLDNLTEAEGIENGEPAVALINLRRAFVNTTNIFLRMREEYGEESRFYPPLSSVLDYWERMVTSASTSSPFLDGHARILSRGFIELLVYLVEKEHLSTSRAMRKIKSTAEDGDAEFVREAFSQLSDSRFSYREGRSEHLIRVPTREFPFVHVVEMEGFEDTLEILGRAFETEMSGEI